MNLRLLVLLPTAAAATLLAACGGGGDGGSGGALPTVSGGSASAAVYSQTLVVTLNGSNLDQGLGASSTGCKNIVLGGTAPFVSSATTAYLKCTVSAVGAQTLSVVRSDGVALASVPYTVAVPQVTLAVSNGAGVSGNLVITLEATKAPLSVDNFLAYVSSGFYAGTVIHRNSPGFVLQGGGYVGPLVANGTLPVPKTTNAAITLEDNAGLSNLKWTVAMARSTAADSATSQFFINLAANTSLDRSSTERGYAVFGTVTAGTEVVAAMAGAPCSLWPAFFGAVDAQGNPIRDCLPSPNLTVTGAIQTR